MANIIRVSAISQTSSEMLMYCNSVNIHFTFLPQGRKANKPTNVNSPPEKQILVVGEKKIVVELRFYKPGSGLCLLGKRISSYVILIKGNFIGKNQYSKL